MSTNKILLLVILIFTLYLAVSGRLDDVWDAITGKKEKTDSALESWTVKEEKNKYSGNPNAFPEGTVPTGFNGGGKVVFL
jgi:hypothetical protein